MSEPIEDITFELDKFMKVRARGKDKGSIVAQSVTVLLLYAIFRELQSLHTTIRLGQERD